MTASDHPIKPVSHRWLDRVEKLGNRLPHPVTLFILFALAVVFISALCAAMGVAATHPTTDEVLTARSLLSAEGARWMLSSAVSNFIHFAPVGPVVVAIMGIAVAEHSGLLACLLSSLARRAPPRLLSTAIIFTGILSSIGFDSGYVVLIPLAALIFKAAGRSPLAGIAAAFAGVSGGYSANLVLGPVDAILAGISTEALQLVSSDEVLASANYFFIIVSTLFISAIGAWVNDHWVEPRLAKPASSEPLTEEQDGPTASAHSQRRALRWVGVFTVVYVVALLWLVLPQDGLLRNPDPNGLTALPLLKGIVVFIALYAAIAGALFGYLSGRYQRSNQWIEGMESGVASLATYLVLMFFAAQFVNYFAWSGLGAIAAISGAQWLAQFDLSTTSLLLTFVLTSAAINLLIGSASAKWALMAPIFVPMLYVLGVSPEAVQMAYRIGDSSTNIITPLMPYFGVVVAFVQRHEPSAGLGTLVALMLPYSLTFLVSWSLLLAVWIGFGLPLGY